MADEKTEGLMGGTPAGSGDQMSIDDLERYCHSYLSAMENLCQSGHQLTGVLQTLCHNTPLEGSVTQWQQYWAGIGKSSSDAGHLVKMEVAKCTQKYWDEDRMNAKSDNNMLILARILFLLFQSQAHFWGCVDQMLPLQELPKGPLDILLSSTPSDLRAVCSSWIRGMQATDDLRLGERLTNVEARLLFEPQGNMGSLKQKLRANLQIYANEMLKLPTAEIELRAGFQSNLPLLSTLLLVSADSRQRQDLLERLMQDRSLQYLNQLHLDKTDNTTTSSSIFEEVKNHLSASFGKLRMVINRNPCSDNMDLTSRLNAITAEVEKVIPGESLINPHFLTLLMALNTHPDVSQLQTLIAVQLVYGHPHVLTVKAQPSNPMVEIVPSHNHSLCARTSLLWNLVCGHPLLEETDCHLATVEAQYEYSLTLTKRGYSSSTGITLRLSKNEELLKSKSCGNVKCREVSPLAVLNVDESMEGLVKGFADMPLPSSSPPVPVRLDLNQDVSGVQGDSTETRAMPTKPQTLVGPTVTITSELSPTEEPGKWAPLGSSRYLGKYRGRPNLASDAEVQDIVDFLSGCPSKHSSGSLLDPPNKSPQDSITPNSSSSSSSNHSSGWGSLGGGDSNAIRYGSFNPQYQEMDGQYAGHKSPLPHSQHLWSGHPHQAHTHPQMGQMFVNDPRMMSDPSNEAEFAHYVAANSIVKRVPLTAECSPTHMQGCHWSPTAGDQMNRTWPGRRDSDNNSRKNSLNNTWSTAHDSASSSDESSNNGESMLSMGLGLSGQNLLHSVSRRRHSSDDACDSIKPNEPIIETNPHFLDVVQMDSKSTKTWPPKVIWQQQRALSPQNQAVGSHREAQLPMVPKDSLNVHPPLTPQWSDPVTFRNQPGWSYMTGSTPVSPAGSMTMIPHGYMPINSSPGHQMPRGHPKLDRRPAHPGHF